MSSNATVCLLNLHLNDDGSAVCLCCMSVGPVATISVRDVYFNECRLFLYATSFSTIIDYFWVVSQYDSFSFIFIFLAAEVARQGLGTKLPKGLEHLSLVWPTNRLISQSGQRPKAADLSLVWPINRLVSQFATLQGSPDLSLVWLTNRLVSQSGQRPKDRQTWPWCGLQTDWSPSLPHFKDRQTSLQMPSSSSAIAHPAGSCDSRWEVMLNNTVPADMMPWCSWVKSRYVKPQIQRCSSF